MLRSAVNPIKYIFKYERLISSKGFYSTKPITLKQEIEVLQLISQKTLNPVDNINKIIDMFKSKDLILNHSVCQSAILHVLDQLRQVDSRVAKQVYMKKLSELLIICLTKFYKNSKSITGVAKVYSFGITYNMLDQDDVLEIIKQLNLCSIKDDIETANEILYTTLPLLYKYYYLTYTWGHTYTQYNGNHPDDTYVKLPNTNSRSELRKLLKLHREENDFDLVKYNYKYNNFDHQGSGKKDIPHIEYEIVKQLPEMGKANNQNSFFRFNKESEDAYLTFADNMYRTKDFAKYNTYFVLQLHQCETSAKRFLLYLLNERKTNQITENDIYVVLAQLTHHLDKILNMDSTQYKEFKDSKFNYLLRNVDTNDYPNLSFILKHSKDFLKEYILKQLYYKSFEILCINQRLGYDVIPDLADDDRMMKNGTILQAKLQFDVVKLPYRSLTKRERTNTKHKKLAKNVLLDYYPKILITFKPIDGVAAYKYNRRFRTGYKRVYERRRLTKKSKVHHLDPVQKENLKFNKVFNPETTKTQMFKEDLVISRNFFMTKLLLKFMFVNKKGALAIGAENGENVDFLDEAVSVLSMFSGDIIFDEVKLEYSKMGRSHYDREARLAKMKNLLLQFIETV